MDKIIRFYALEKSGRDFDGDGSGEKTKRKLGNDVYLIKFPEPLPEEKRKHGFSYRTSPYSEYIGSHIYQILGFDAQDTLLGVDKVYRGREFTVVGCKDFREDWQQIYSLQKIRKSIESDPSNPRQKEFHSTEKDGPRLNKILEIIDSINTLEGCDISPDDLKRHFWNMFIVDAFIQNFDRHNENWGIIADRDKGRAQVCPVYDCGSSLGAMVEDNLKYRMARNPAAFTEDWISGFSAITINGQKIDYDKFLLDRKAIPDDCRKALLRVLPIIRVKADEINRMIDNMPVLDGNAELQRTFYKTMLLKRKELILERSAKELGLSNQIDIYEEKLRKMMANGQPLPSPDRKDMLLAMIMAPDKEKIPEKETAKRKPSGKGGHDSIDF